MPRERRDRSLSVDGPVMPHFLSSTSSSSSSHSKPSENGENIKEWEEARCPVCIEHPHNAVLLLCSSHDKGCRPYMCDTSYRHSNCFDKFCKSFVESKNEGQQQQDEEDQEENPTTITSSLPEVLPPVISTPVLFEKQVKENLVCPLCRGQVSQWVVMESARNFMDLKTRTCASETCEFTGSYKDLRKHARLEHPSERPSEADPERQRNWRRLERQRDLGDLISTLQSSTGEEWAEDGTLPIDEGGWLTVFFLIRVFRPGTSLSRSSRTARIGRLREREQSQSQPQSLQPPQPAVRRRRSARLWGETRNSNDETATGSRENNNTDSQSSEDGFGPWRRHVRRRFAPEEDEE
ncbi:uncharacterized protein LOC124932876 [Impatiens glandulifera]|uniref:uncharacterized protein LOC124932876 n=1 Tax=Impatiens glandulifera TaxID=253017 RepID=UPI001FB157FD|nr:uncharacterized protein LOC124932876 [Impatiens glandulifera]